MGDVMRTKAWFGISVALFTVTEVVFAQSGVSSEQQGRDDSIPEVMFKLDGPGVLFDEKNDVEQSTLPGDVIEPDVLDFPRQVPEAGGKTTSGSEAILRVDL